MKKLRRSILVLAAATLASAPRLHAEELESVPVYTNADLEKYGPPSPITGVREGAEADWSHVQEYLDREYARIDADREHQLRQRESDRRDVLVDTRRTVAVPFGFFGRPLVLSPLYGLGSPEPCASESLASDGAPAPPGPGRLRAFLSRRETIHGRPHVWQQGHGRFGSGKGSQKPGS